jgi:hypothetical protein
MPAIPSPVLDASVTVASRVAAVNVTESVPVPLRATITVCEVSDM